MVNQDFTVLTEIEANGIQEFPKPASGSWTAEFGLDTGPVSFKGAYDREFFELEREAVFRRNWLNIGRVDADLPRKGTYFTKELEFLGVSVLVVRDMDDPNAEPEAYMARSALLLATKPLDEVSGRVTYSQVLLKEYGLIDAGRGIGFERDGSGYSVI